jgi:hypothetical protein
LSTRQKKRPITSIKLESREIVIDEDLLKVLRKYALTQMTLEELAKELGLEGWEEAYELVKKTPAWLIWTPFTLWEVTE